MQTLPGSTWMPRAKRLAGADRRADPVPRSRVGWSSCGQHVHPLERRLLVLGRALHLGELPGALGQPFGDRLARVRRPSRPPRASAGRWKAARATPSARIRLAATEAARRIAARLDLVRLAQADQQDRGPPGRADRAARSRPACRLKSPAAASRCSAPPAARSSSASDGGQRPARHGDRQQRRLVAGGCGSDDGGLERHSGICESEVRGDGRKSDGKLHGRRPSGNGGCQACHHRPRTRRRQPRRPDASLRVLRGLRA